MNRPPRSLAVENPFSTSRVRPGAIAYVFPAGETAESLADRLRANGWWGQIVGPHGSGKSALLATLIPALERAGRQPLLIELHDGARRLPVDVSRVPGLTQDSLVIVDGYEQLSHWNRWRLKRFCRRRGVGLVVSSHAPVGLPHLFSTSTSVALARQLVDQLLGDGQPCIAADEVERRFVARGGDMREMLFDLYDQYERRLRDGNRPSP